MRNLGSVCEKQTWHFKAIYTLRIQLLYNEWVSFVIMADCVGVAAKLYAISGIISQSFPAYVLVSDVNLPGEYENMLDTQRKYVFPSYALENV